MNFDLTTLLPVTDYGLTYLAMRAHATDEIIMKYLAKKEYGSVYNIFCEVMFCCMADPSPYMENMIFRAYAAIEDDCFDDVNREMFEVEFRGKKFEVALASHPNAAKICKNNGLVLNDRIVMMYGTIDLIRYFKLESPVGSYLMSNPRLTYRDFNCRFDFVPPIRLVDVECYKIIEDINRDPTLALRYLDSQAMALVCGACQVLTGIKLPRGVAGIIVSYYY